MTLWQDIFYHSAENDYVCLPKFFNYESGNYQLYRLRRLFLRCIEFCAERHQEDQNRKSHRMYFLCDLWDLQ